MTASSSDNLPAPKRSSPLLHYFGVAASALVAANGAFFFFESVTHQAPLDLSAATGSIALGGAAGAYWFWGNAVRCARANVGRRSHHDQGSSGPK
jgi:hypothetical protein